MSFRRRRTRRKKSPRSGFTLGHFIFGLSLLTVIVAAWFVWFGYGFFRSEFPDVTTLKSRYPVVRYHGKDKGKPTEVVLLKERPSSWVDLNQVSKVAVGAVIVSEDWAFYS